MMEEIVARYADGLNYDSETPEDFAEKKNRVRAACDKVGRDFDERARCGKFMKQIIRRGVIRKCTCGHIESEYIINS